MVEVRATHLTLGKGTGARLRDASVTLPPGTLTAIVGPNGAGKSTLLRASAGLEPDVKGDVRIDGRGVLQMRAWERAQLLAYMPQSPDFHWPISVVEAVALGRFAAGTQAGAAQNDAAVRDAMECTDCAHLAARPVTRLSGGEQQRVSLARTLAAQTPVVLLDEPVAALDPAHQLTTMALLAERAAEGRTIGVVLHDLALAARFCDAIVWMRDGTVEAVTGSEDATLVAMTQRIFGTSVAVHRDTASGAVMIAHHTPG